jgi:hypothetical protein
VLTPPLAIDYLASHELEVSYGSLYPSEDDLMFTGFSSDSVAALKGRVTISLDGARVLDAETESYESTPEEVKVGRNDLGGSTSNPLFTGEIIDSKRVWPETK